MIIKRRLLLAGLALSLALLITLSGLFILAPYRNLDVLIANGMVVDGFGGQPYVCDVAIRDGKIIAIGRWQFLFSQPKLYIDARGKIVAPGFIDVHTHVEPNLPASGPFRPANFLRQGVTTLITGNCGRSRVDIGDLFKGLENNGSYINVATLIGHNSIRQQVMGQTSRRPTPNEITRMQDLVTQAIMDGALGLSSGLCYVPGRFAEIDEIVSLAKVAAQHDGLYVSHIRNEGRNGIEAINEALEVGRSSGAATHISHFKSSGPLQWHGIEGRLRLIDDAREDGQQVTIDVYPYDRSSTTTDVLLPDRVLEENRSGLRKVFRDQQARKQLHAEIMAKLKQDGWSNLRHVLLASGHSTWIGRTLAEAPRSASGMDGQVENLIDVSLRGGAQAIYMDMHESDVDRVVVSPYCVFGTDSSVRDPTALYKPHPRGCGTFPRIFRRYVREAKLLELSQAIYKTSALAADIFGLENRGRLRAGDWADIVIFDLENIKDQADYEHPFAEPSGIDYVVVNGVVAVDHGNLTGNAPSGLPLRKKK